MPETSSPTLLPHHRRELEVGSGILPEIIASRGYFSATTKTELSKLGFPASQQLAPALVIPLFHPDGSTAGYQIKPDSPRDQPKPENPDRAPKKIKYETPAKQKNVLDVHPDARQLLSDPNIPVIITEGAKKADAGFGAWRRPIICLSGVENWRGQNDLGGIVALAQWNDIPFKGPKGPRRFFIAFDSDISENRNVKRAAEKLAHYIHSKGGEVKYFTFSSVAGAKVGIDDYIVGNGPIIPLIQNALDYPPGWAPSEKSEKGRRAIITNNRNLDEITVEAIDVLAAKTPATAYVRDGHLVYTFEEEDQVSIRQFNRWGLLRALGECADWISVQGEDKPPKHSSPPLDVCDSIIYQSRTPKGINKLQGIAPAPFVTPGGIVSEYGYNQRTEWFMGSRLQAIPFEGDAQAAADWLMLEILGDFPFNDEPSKTHALSMILLPFFRAAIDGPTPLHFVDAPQSGTGKSMLVEVCLRPGVGEALATLSLEKSDEQFEKTFNGMMVNGAPVIWIDNLGRYFANDKVESAITEEKILIRRMGSDAISSVTPKCIWALTSNNGKIKEDFLRRSAYIRLNAKVEDPASRSGFRHANLRQWVKNNRTLIWGPILKIAQAWVDAGAPRASIKGNASFPEWSAVMGGVLGLIGREDLMANSQTMAANVGVANGEDVQELALAAMERYGSGPFFLKELVEIAGEKEILGNVLGDGTPRAQSTKLGTWLNKRHEQVSGGFLVERSTMQRGMARFKFTKVVDHGGPPTSTHAREDTDKSPKDLFSNAENPIAQGERSTKVHHNPHFEPDRVVDLGENTSTSIPIREGGTIV